MLLLFIIISLQHQYLMNTIICMCIDSFHNNEFHQSEHCIANNGLSAESLVAKITSTGQAWIAMPPKVLDPPQAKKRLEMKTAGKILEESKTAKSLQIRKNELKSEIQKLAVQRKAAQRKARNLKKKAANIDASALMQMVMMKAFVLNKASAESSTSGASSSGEEWVPVNAQAAMDRIFDLSVAGGDTGLASFVKSALSNTEPQNGSDA